MEQKKGIAKEANGIYQTGCMKETERKKFEIFNDQHYCDCSVQSLATAQ